MADILFPCGRMIGGSVYKPYPTLDNFGKPKMNADGSPDEAFSFGLAIKKGGEQHWSQTPWGAQVLAVGQAAHPQACNSPHYAWKIKDGDSTVPNRNGKLLSATEGCAGCWVIWFKQKWAPRLVTEKGRVQVIEPEGIMPGYYIEVLANVVGNTGPTPGVYLNPVAVNRVAYGEKLAAASVDTASVGFGESAVPAGASATPIGGGMMQQPPVAPAFAPPPPKPVAPPPPNPAILQLPPVHEMTPAAGGATYEAMIAIGWTDELLVQHGMMLPKL